MDPSYCCREYVPMGVADAPLNVAWGKTEHRHCPGCRLSSSAPSPEER